MIKRWMFFLSYVVFFTAVPLCVYYSWHVDSPFDNGMWVGGSDRMEAYLQEPHLNSDSTADSINPYLSVDLHWEDSVKRKADSIDGVDNSHVMSNEQVQQYYDQMSDGFESIAKTLPFSIATLACFFLSLIFALVLAIRKLRRLSERSGWIVGGICIFNLLYLPVMLYFILSKAGAFSWYGILPIFEIMERMLGIVFGFLSLTIFLTTIILALIGAIKAKPIVPKR